MNATSRERKRFGYNLVAAMANANVSTKVLAADTFTEECTVSCWRNGRHLPPITKAVKICRVLGCTMDDLTKGM
jgi:transcriptional regulator with XRE-family HTH domain